MLGNSPFVWKKAAKSSGYNPFRLYWCFSWSFISQVLRYNYLLSPIENQPLQKYFWYFKLPVVCLSNKSHCTFQDSLPSPSRRCSFVQTYNEPEIPDIVFPLLVIQIPIFSRWAHFLTFYSGLTLAFYIPHSFFRSFSFSFPHNVCSKNVQYLTNILHRFQHSIAVFKTETFLL